MNYIKSDLRGRLPLFEGYRSTIGDTSGRTYDYIDPTIPAMMTGCVAVGLNPDNTLAIPKSYEPEEGPPVLMLHPGENVNVRWSEGMEKATSHTLALARASGWPDLSPGVFSTNNSVGTTHTVHVNLSLPNDPQTRLESLEVPVFISARTETGLLTPSEVLAHECDHWDFYLRDAPLLSVPDAPTLPPRGKHALAEKRAYIINYKQMTNSDVDPNFMTAEELCHYLSGHDPATAGRTAMNLLQTLSPSQNRFPTATLALSMYFADADESVRINELEVDAYRAIGII